MFDWHCLSESMGGVLGDFSRAHCVSICAFLVPANLIATSQTMLFTVLKRSPLQIFTMTFAASIYAMLMILHVVSWLIVGVVMAPTFILLFLGVTCLTINAIAIWIKISNIEFDYLGVYRKVLQKLSFKSDDAPFRA